MALAAGARLGTYEIQSAIGAGGMGEVYRATDTKLGRDVALKILPAAFTTDPQRVARFRREAQVLASLNHPHIGAIYGLDDANGTQFLVLELVDGESLDKRIARGKIPTTEAVAVAGQIADALAAAHEKGIVHRDLKPANIAITSGGNAKVLDFGLARHATAGEMDDTRLVERLTAAGAVIGTPHYMSPEVLQGKPADVRSDIWAVGVVLYEMLAGRLPFEGGSAIEVSSTILRDETPSLPAVVPRRLRAIVDRCLAKRPDDRYQHAAHVRNALVELQAATRARRHVKPAFWAVGASAVLVVASLFILRPGGTAGRLTSTGAPASRNQEANEAFELAMQLQHVQNDVPRANEMLERSLALDPHFAEARRNHAFNYVITILNGYTNDTNLLYKAEDELREAAQDDPALPSLPSALTAVYLMQGRRDRVPIEALDATVRSNSSPETLGWRAMVWWLGENNTRAKELWKRILERDPLMGPARMFLGEVLRTEGDIPAAIREEQKVLDQAPGNIAAIRFLTIAYMDASDLDRAENLVESKRQAFERNYMWRSTRALLFAREGKRDDARAAMDEETLKFLGAAFPATLDAAEFYALMGDASKAIEWLDRAVRNGDERTGWFRRDPRLASVQSDARFQNIITSVAARQQRREVR
jgi:tetratricopeptide (TPR) repeat protein